MTSNAMRIGCAALLACLAVSCTSVDTGGFTRTVWAPREQVGGNRFRVNSPDTATGRFKDRPEAKATGRMTIALDDLADVEAAGLYLELWGGHPGVADKRVTVNDGAEHPLPEVGAAAHHCTYSYPEIPLDVSDLCVGANRFQFACEKGETFWGHFLIRAAAVRMKVTDDHPMVRESGLAGFSAKVASCVDGETVKLTIDASQVERIASVAFQGRYRGYDDNGDGRADDWHGYTKDREQAAFVAMATDPPFAATWDVSMLSDQPSVEVRAIVTFSDAPELSYTTEPTRVRMPLRAASVTIYGVSEMPTPFWSRADRPKVAVIDLPVDPATIEQAQLHILIWDGGAGEVDEHFTLNGHSLPIAGEGHHDVLYRIIDIAPSILSRGANEMVLRSDTVHHGVEVILPGPALVVRTRGQ